MPTPVTVPNLGIITEDVTIAIPRNPLYLYSTGSVAHFSTCKL